MGSLTGVLNTANSALRFNQNAIATVSNNVANANTVGYTRQVIVAENQVLNGSGQGVSSGTITRYANQSLQTNMDKQAANVSYNKTVDKFLATVESQFGKLSKDDDKTKGSATNNLDSQISDMFTQMNNLVQNPTLSSNRVTFKNSTVQTAARLNTLSTDLKETQVSVDNQITEELVVINTALKNISKLNAQVEQVERANGNSSDLKDLRQKEIAKVSEYLQVTTKEKDDGVVHVTLNSGKVLVDSTYVEMTRVTGSPYGGIGYNRVLNSEGDLGTTQQILNADDLSSGSIGAKVDLRDKKIPDLLAQLDSFAKQFVEEFNNIHAQGSAVPPPATLTSIQHANGGATLLTDIGLTNGTDFDISVVDKDGKAVGTTANLPYTGAVGASTVTGITTGTFDPEAYLTANGKNATIEGNSNLEYLGGNMYRLTDPSGSIHTATLNPAAFPVGAGAPAELTFGNGMTLNVNSGTAEPVVGNIGTVENKVTGGPIRIEPGETITDLAAKINSNPALAGQMTATVTNGQLELKATNSNNGIVLGNDPTGSTFNSLGFNRYFEGDTAGTIAVSKSITSDLNNIATGRMRSDGGFTSTNNENAVALASLQNQKFHFAEAGGLNEQDSTLSEYFASITSSFAADVSANKQQQEFNEALHKDFSSRVQSLSGVNTDEEFSKLIVYQRSFEAASRIMNTVDEMLKTLMGII